MNYYIDKTLPNNLRLDKNGNLFCLDGKKVQDYILESYKKAKKPTPVVLVSRELFLLLNKLAYNNELQKAMDDGIILAA